MELERPSKHQLTQESGIVLFMVMGAIAMLSIVVTEMAFLSTVSKRIAYDALDQVKAQYLAETGFKISLLRLKAYQSIKKFVNSQSKGNPAIASMLPKAMLEQVWAQPFVFPIPSNLPGLSLGDKAAIEKFQQATGMEGRFTTLIQSESARLNLNMLLAPFVPAAPSPSPSPGAAQPQASGATPSPTPSFDPQAARESIYKYLYQLLQTKFEAEPEFAQEYRDFRLDDFMDALSGWMDRNYNPKTRTGNDDPPYKRAPLYSLTELRMLPSALGFDETLYQLFTAGLTVSTTPGINVNSMETPTLRALVPTMTKEEAEAFFKFRDDRDNDNTFKNADAFFSWLQSGVASFRNNADEVRRFREDLEKRNIRVITDESEFRILAQGTMNQVVRSIEARVTLVSAEESAPNAPGQLPASPTLPGPPSSPNAQPTPNPGIRVTFMRIL